MKKGLALLIATLLILLSLAGCKSFEELESLEFSDLTEASLGFNLTGGEIYEGEIIVKPANIDISKIELILDKPDLADAKILSKEYDKIKYCVRAKHNGTIKLFAQASNTAKASSSKLFKISGGTDFGKDYYLNEAIAYKNIKYIATDLSFSETITAISGESIKAKNKFVNIGICIKNNSDSRAYLYQTDFTLATPEGITLLPSDFPYIYGAMPTRLSLAAGQEKTLLLIYEIPSVLDGNYKLLIDLYITEPDPYINLSVRA